MRILGIAYIAGSLETQKNLHHGLDHLLEAVATYTAQQSEAEIEILLETFVDMSDISKILKQIKLADAVVVSAPTFNLGRVNSFVKRVHHKIELRGKWFGLIASGVASPFQIEENSDKVIGSCNRAGMLLVPEAVARINVGGSFESCKVLGRNAAIALSSMSEWKGRTAWQEQEAA